MRAVVSSQPGVLEINWSWLPTIIGMNRPLQTQIVDKVAAKIVGRPLDDETLDLAHDLVVDEIVNAFSRVEGLREFIDGLKFIRYLNDGERTDV